MIFYGFLLIREFLIKKDFFCIEKELMEKWFGKNIVYLLIYVRFKK